MLKLTGVSEGTAIYVVASKIIGLRLSSGGGTSIYATGYTFEVAETPEQIMGMPEMLNAMYPPMMVVSPNGGPSFITSPSKLDIPGLRATTG